MKLPFIMCVKHLPLCNAQCSTVSYHLFVFRPWISWISRDLDSTNRGRLSSKRLSWGWQPIRFSSYCSAEGKRSSIGHVPKALARYFYFCLQKEDSKITCKITGKRLNRGVSRRLEVPCLYIFVGHCKYIKKLKDLLVNLLNFNHLWNELVWIIYVFCFIFSSSACMTVLWSGKVHLGLTSSGRSTQ